MDIYNNTKKENTENEILRIAGEILAIDFGTCNTSASFEHNKQPVSVVFADSLLMPSVLYWPNKHKENHVVFVGQRAYAHSFSYGENDGFYINNLKYDLGSTIHTRDEFRKKMNSILPIDDKCNGLDPEDMVSLILRFVKEEAQRQAKDRGLVLPKGFERAVIGVPARANQAYRTSMLRSAEMAGFKNTKLVAEPVAACRYYLDRHPFPKDELLLVVDIGAGTTDLTIVRHEGNGNFSVLISYGNTRLGGNEVDLQILKNILYTIEDDYNSLFHRKNLDEIRRLKEVVNAYFDDENFSIDRNITLLCNNTTTKKTIVVSSKAVLEGAEPIALQVIGTISDALEQFRNVINNNQDKAFPRISRCILIGGAIKTINIYKKLKEIGINENFKEYITPDIKVELNEPETSVSHGLMLFGNDWKHGRLNQSERFVYTRSPLDIGVAIIERDKDGKLLTPKCYRHDVHIEQNSSPNKFPPKSYGIPYEYKEDTIDTVVLNFLTGGKYWVPQKKYELELKRPNECKVIGNLIVELKPPRLGKYIDIRIQYVLDDDGIFRVSITPMGFEDLATNKYFPDQATIEFILEHNPLSDDVVKNKVDRNNEYKLILTSIG